MVLWCILALARNAIASKVSDYVQLALPRPDNPDFYSVAVARGRAREEVKLPKRYLGLPMDRVDGEPVLNSRTVWEQARSDGAALSNHLYSIASWSRSIITERRHPGSYSDEVEDQERKFVVMESFEKPQEDQAIEQDDNESIASAEDEFDSTNSRPERTATATEPTAPSSSTRNNTERTSPTGLDNGSLVRDPSKPSHRITKLSQCLANNMAESVSSMVADIILLPLETLLVRSLAITYLATPGLSPTSSHWIREQIYPTGSWFGMGLRGGRAMDYARKMVLCFGMEMVLGYGVWQIGAGVTWGVGKWFFNWGRL
ncbi:MAG: hypothetical protein LQ350_003484 [Teloschistes chrysophthalmus]|nr:MAG: hypothetical protein LQ350_003484 [Niorma chrysophthalma]